jgi:lipid II:glycine glycyltransferase (peptidoglycan interpeptide bridge formation enzyme)
MLSDIHKKEVAGLYETPIVQQTAFWSAVKERLGSETLAINFKSYESLIYNNRTEPDRSDVTVYRQGEFIDKPITSDLLVIVKQVSKKYCIAYVPYGPELEPNEEFQAIFLEELSESLRSFLPSNCIMIRYDLCWESWWSKHPHHYDEFGNWKGEPGIDSRELRFNINTINRNFRKAGHNILPSNTIYIDLRPSLDEILHRMKPKTRYNIGLADRKNVKVRATGIDHIDTWYELYTQTAHRNRIFLNDMKYFEAVLLANVENAKSSAEVRLLIAEKDDIPLAAMFLIISGNRGSYLYGASSDNNRNLMGTYALQLEAIKIAREMGCTEYDMFGISPNSDSTHPLYGLYKFKIGFGGNLYHSLGSWDYPLFEQEYEAFICSELTFQGFHLN